MDQEENNKLLHMYTKTDICQTMIRCFVIFILFSSCDTKTVDKDTDDSNLIRFQLEGESNLGTQEIYLSKVRSMSVTNGNLVFIDRYEDRFLSLDTSTLGLGFMFNKSGESPSELLEPVQLYADNNSMYIFNQSPPQLSELDLNGNINRIRLPQDDFPYGHASERFLMDQGGVIISNHSNGYPFTRFELGNSKNSESSLPRRFSNLHCDEKYIYSICKNRPYIDVFDKTSYAHIKSFDFSENYLFKNNLKKEKEMGLEPNGNAMMIHVRDSYYNDNRLFLLVNDHTRHGISDVVMIFDIQNGDVSFSKFGLLFSGYSYSTICANQNYLYTYNDNKSKIQKYSFAELN